MLPDGARVAVKIQRPGVAEQVDRDLSRGRILASILEWSGVSLVASPREVVDEVSDWLHQELDFTREAANLARMGHLASGSDSEIVPLAYRSLCSSRVVTAEYLEGEPVSAVLEALRTTPFLERERLEGIGIDLHLVSQRLLQTTLRQIFDYQFFHADPHPGNLLILPENRVGYVDFGLCDTLDATIAESQLRYLGALYRHDPHEMLRALEEIAVPSDRTDMAAFRRDFLDEVDRWSSARAEARAGWNVRAEGERSPVATYMVRVMRAIRRHDLRIPARALSMYRALLTAETVASRLAPEVDLANVGRDFFTRRQRREVLKGLEPEQLQPTALALVELRREGPARVNQVLADLADGQLAVNVQVDDNARTHRARTRYVRILVTALLSIGVSLLLSRPALPRVLGVPLDAVLGVSLVLLYISIIVQWRRLGW